ncbi:MAG: 50S ribosomal protein L25, partial [Bacteroidota bacterium]
VLYSKDGVKHFTTTHNAVKTLIFTPEFKVAEVDLDGQKHRCIVKDIQWHPVTDEILHLDFLSLIDGHPVKVEVPVRFVGTAPGIRAGGKIQQAVRRIKIKTTPEKIVSELTLDISGLELGQSIRVRDIEPMEGVEIMNPPGTPVGTIEIPRALRSAAAAEKKAAATE